MIEVLKFVRRSGGHRGGGMGSRSCLSLAKMKPLTAGILASLLVLTLGTPQALSPTAKGEYFLPRHSSFVLFNNVNC
ncbi:hypothetical protein QE152_g36205 [Popillia japonica]|uniref:Uncharacterized protein n=1 Tax=Popillia japonica TaxID=7064 RepID=A0AAW1IDV0_POPJA